MGEGIIMLKTFYKITYPYGRIPKEFKTKKAAINYIIKYKLQYAEIHKMK